MNTLEEINYILALGDIDPTGSFLEKVQADETVVGICSKDIMILLTYKNTLLEKKADWDAALEATDKKEDEKNYLNYRGKSWLLREKIEMLESLINLSIHADHPELLTRDIAIIREGWQIVWSNSKPRPDILPSVIGALKSLSQPRPTSLAGKN